MGNSDECPVCNGFDIEKWQEEQLAEHGWYVHIVPQENGLIDVHSHGAEQNFQTVLPIDPKVTHSVIGYFIDKVKAGERFEGGHVDLKALQNGFKVKLLALEKPDCFRIILPDPDGNLDEEKMEDAYAAQFDMDVV